MPCQNKLRAKLTSRFQAQAELKTKAWWENYVKHNSKFRGLGIPMIRKSLKEWMQHERIAELPLDEQLDLALSFFPEKYAEDKLAGILFLQYHLYDKFDWELPLARFDRLFKDGCISDWNICDWFCVRVLGPMIKKNGTACAKAISKWNQAPSVWQARCSVVAFANLARHKEFTPLILQSSRKLIKREERFAKTAVG